MPSSLTALLRVATLLPFCDIDLPLEQRVYSHSLAEFLLDTESETGVLAAAEKRLHDALIGVANAL